MNISKLNRLLLLFLPACFIGCQIDSHQNSRHLDSPFTAAKKMMPIIKEPEYVQLYESKINIPEAKVIIERIIKKFDTDPTLDRDWFYFIKVEMIQDPQNEERYIRLVFNYCYENIVTWHGYPWQKVFIWLSPISRTNELEIKRIYTETSMWPI